MSAPSPQECRVAFKGWDHHRQRAFVIQLIEELAYYSGINGGDYPPAMHVKPSRLLRKLHKQGQAHARVKP